MCIKKSCVLGDIFVTWGGATLKFESSDQIAEGIIMLAWHKQEIESESVCLVPGCHCPNKFLRPS